MGQVPARAHSANSRPHVNSALHLFRPVGVMEVSMSRPIIIHLATPGHASGTEGMMNLTAMT